jgi:hypothetical protein
MAKYYRSDRAVDPSQSDELEMVMLADKWGSNADFRPDFTSKNRLKTSAYETSFFNTFQFGKETDVWDESTANGGSATHSSNLSGVIMSVTGTLNSEVIRQTKHVMRYIPGRTSTLSFAIRLETPVVGIRRRFGLFDENNGAYFEDAGDGNYYCVIRSKTSGMVSETRVARENWNGDKLDGTGRSGITANPIAQHMINIEYEWYGAGQVKFSYVINGETHHIHTFNTANVLNAVWSATPFLPIRLELKNITGVAGTHYLYQGSNSIISEGVPEKLGTSQNVITPLAGRNMVLADTFYPILSIRLKSTALQGIALPTSFQAATTDNASIFYKLVLNPTLTNSSWSNMSDPNSFTQYDISSTALSGGTDLDSGFVVSGASSTIQINSKTANQLGRSSMGTISDILTLAVACGTANKNAIASMTWIEQR